MEEQAISASSLHLQGVVYVCPLTTAHLAIRQVLDVDLNMHCAAVMSQYKRLFRIELKTQTGIFFSFKVYPLSLAATEQ
jgi:hypothetical protein